MKRIDQETFICLDCETTGLNLDTDQIIEIALMKFNFSSVLEEFESLICPTCQISDISLAIHHITLEMVQGKPAIQNLLPNILKMIGNHIIIGHGIQFDIDMIAKACEKYNLDTTIKKNRTLDTLRLARLYGESPINSLEQLRRHFNIEYEGTHRAMGDVIVNVNVFKNLCTKFTYVDQVFDVLSRPILMKIMPLGPHKGRAFKDIPLEYLLWAARKDFDNDLLFSIRSEIKRRKKGNLFSQVTNPFSSL